MVCFKLLYMDNLWLVEDKGKKVDTERLVQNHSTVPLQSSSGEKEKKEKKNCYKWFGK